jgi:hypothetical protein
MQARRRADRAGGEGEGEVEVEVALCCSRVGCVCVALPARGTGANKTAGPGWLAARGLMMAGLLDGLGWTRRRWPTAPQTRQAEPAPAARFDFDLPPG